MCRFIETIRIEDGEICNLTYHQQRLEATVRRFWPGAEPLRLDETLLGVQPAQGVSKVRVVYGEKGLCEIDCAPYTPRKVERLRMVEADDADYAYKSADRRQLTAIAAQRGDCDEVIIVRHGLLTDTSYSNIALFDGHVWATPRHPLLPGTMRRSLLEAGLLEPRDIRPADLVHYQKLCLINAMLPLGRLTVPIEGIE